MQQPLTDLQLLTCAWQNECDGWLLLGAMPGSAFAVERHGPATYAWWQAEPGAMDNYIMIDARYDGDLHEVVRPVLDRMEKSASRTVIRFAESGPHQRWCVQGNAWGFSPSGTVPVMACRLDEPRPCLPITEQMQVQQVASDQNYDEAFEVVHAVYGGSRDITRFFNPKGMVRMTPVTGTGYPQPPPPFGPSLGWLVFTALRPCPNTGAVGWRWRS